MVYTASRGSWVASSLQLDRLSQVVYDDRLSQVVDDNNNNFEDDDDHEKEEQEVEQSPLVENSSSPCRTSISYGSVGNSHGKNQRKRRSSVTDILAEETSSMVRLAIPVIGTYLLEMLPGIVSIILVGHVHSPKTEEYIDAAALAVMFMNMTGLSVGFGLASAMDTLCSQAHGAGEGHKTSIYLQTGIIVLSLAFVLVFVLNYNATIIFLWLGQPEEISELAGAFNRWLIPGIPFLFMYELLRKILQAQNNAMPMLYVSIAANVVNIGLGYHLTFFTEVGWIGAAIARTVCNISFLVFMVTYLFATGSWRTFWGEQSRWNWNEAVRGIRRFTNLGIPGALQLCFEWWAFEVMALICGLLPDAVLAIGTNAILLNISSMVYMLYLGVSISANVRIGNALGAGSAKRAKMCANVALGLAVGCALLCAVFLIVFRTSLPALFTHDQEIIDYCSKLLYIAAAFQVPDAVNGVIQGIFKGTGRQSFGAYLNFAAYYIVGIPIGVLLAFHLEQGVMGLWVGMTIGLFIVGTVGMVLVYRSDWPALVEETIARLSVR
mmetsp:Transcript_11264/g.16552  ORF Transcript_11264/g.16552 Transcript_11264/m.16552 type:complete len:550 (+) Transcript_11264:55-1704(+)|eukprot:CAMPEP_0194225456 /NCGR_PEP_ID=MMETSP0156-20130528/39645_1 /TAXON_ID=33649 /ORGANISM="Thalassionema nitzschioides, Strain L26-B" /LENGTH=549 /DNA_ID=CAMNT_0038957397 /DNA_START=50 /DNA_END=1699 /DNA_ORIENTATION=-